MSKYLNRHHSDLKVWIFRILRNKGHPVIFLLNHHHLCVRPEVSEEQVLAAVVLAVV